jgi:hypothetical protein
MYWSTRKRANWMELDGKLDVYETAILGDECVILPLEQTVKAKFGSPADSGRERQHNDGIPDVRDGLTREERLVLYVLHETQKERGDRNVPTAMLWGRVCEHFYISPDDLSAMLARLGARR